MSPDILQKLDSEARAALNAGRADPGVALLADTMEALNVYNVEVPDMVTGALLEVESPVAMKANALELVLSQIAEMDARTPAHKIAARDASSALDELIRLPSPLRDVALEAAGDAGWKFGGPGIRTLTLDLGGDTEVQIMRLQAGQRVPRHTHVGNEYTLCLEGGFSDERGSYGPGEVSIADGSVMHTPVADDDGDCLVLAVTDAGLKFTGVLGVLQRVFG